jgi:hypothetical protein
LITFEDYPEKISLQEFPVPKTIIKNFSNRKRIKETNDIEECSICDNEKAKLKKVNGFCLIQIPEYKSLMSFCFSVCFSCDYHFFSRKRMITNTKTDEKEVIK